LRLKGVNPRIVQEGARREFLISKRGELLSCFAKCLPITN
jgi:hypothetical protein